MATVGNDERFDGGGSHDLYNIIVTKNDDVQRIYNNNDNNIMYYRNRGNDSDTDLLNERRMETV